ncbi:hypothetical protein [Prescottella agglutinans]|uniref:Uncharacterized protein n=1 Tax=Prescottella agglutinans TaxID=1644129 RepID=A0ABT6MIX5_9NOCA|nr:hypothetical protein [Prescottella agglutinans]MDH6284277.1 hypothetical protein [Prescottella agglutinans]
MTNSTNDVVELLANDEDRIVASWGVIYHLTPCCGASGKGSMDAIVCRSCYHEVDDLYALGWVVHDEQDWARFSRHVTAMYPGVSAGELERMRALAAATRAPLGDG